MTSTTDNQTTTTQTPSTPQHKHHQHHPPHPLSGVQKTLGPDLYSKITSSKILLVGSGGIGCELLKNLALSGFRTVEVIDLDTIDVSNLNRQFLFRRSHVGMPKCTVACDAARSMVPYSPTTTTTSTTVNYIPHHGNVCDNTRFNVQYVSQFSLVMNALDNVQARRRVNRLCLAASVPLIEAGTTGYLGQITVIDKQSGVECYECQPKPTQKVYPICTIRSTPSMPVHTIVWAKELYKLCFGEKVEDSMLFEDTTMEDGEKSTYMDAVNKLRDLMKDNETGTECVGKAVGEVLIALYNTEIEKQLGMDRFKTAQKVPTSIPTQTIKTAVDAFREDTVPPSKRDGYKPTDVYSITSCIEELLYWFLQGANALRAAATTTSAKSTPSLPEFDKDDTLAMHIVTSSSNLRSYVFSIEPIQSYYSAKGIAGNIVPAIATTNAIVAGLQVLQAFHILKRRNGASSSTSSSSSSSSNPSIKDICRYTYCLRDRTRKGFYLLPTTLPSPNPACYVCRNASVNVALDTTKWTLSMFLRRILKKELGFMEPTVMIGDDIISEEGEGADAEGFKVNMPKLLVDLPAGGVKHGTVVVVEDFTQDLEVNVCVSHKGVWEMRVGESGVEEVVEEEERFLMNKPNGVEGKNGGDGGKGAGSKTVVEGGDTGEGKEEVEEDDDDIVVVSGNDDSKDHLKKRELIVDDDDDGAVENGGPKKRMRAGE